jgi:hypothetical protein
MMIAAVRIASTSSFAACFAALCACSAPVADRDAGALLDARPDASEPVSDASDAGPGCRAEDAFAWGRGGIDMLPGSDCLSCHRADASAGSFAFTAAGTVFSSSSCRDGLPDVTVILRDSTGREARLTTSALGNFSTSLALTPPLRASVAYNGREIAMRAELDHGSCNSCHRVDRPLGLLPAPL